MSLVSVVKNSEDSGLKNFFWILHFVTDDIFSQSYYQQVDSMTYLLSYYQLADSMTEKHCFGITLLVMSSPFK